MWGTHVGQDDSALPPGDAPAPGPASCVPAESVKATARYQGSGLRRAPHRGLFPGPDPPCSSKVGLESWGQLWMHAYPPSSCGGPGQGPSICHPSGQTASPLQDSAPISKRQGLEKMKSSLPEFQQFLSTGLGEPLEDTPNVGQKGWGRNQLGKWLRPRGHNGPRTFLGLLLVSLRAPSGGPPCPEHLADAGCAQSVLIFEEAV